MKFITDNRSEEDLGDKRYNHAIYKIAVENILNELLKSKNTQVQVQTQIGL